MPFNPFSAITSKIFGAIALALLVWAGVQEFRIRGYRADLAECRSTALQCQVQNDHYADTLTAITRDAAAFEKRALAAEAAKRKADATANARLQAIIKRLTENATPQDNAPVSGALRDALGVVRQ